MKQPVKQKLTPIAIGICLLSLMTVPAFAATHSQTLEQQVNELQKEVAALKASHSSQSRHHVKIQNQDPPSQTTHTGLTPRQASIQAGQAQAVANQPEVSGPQYLPQTGLQYLPIDVDVPGQSFVSTGPYIGVPLQYNGYDLIVNSPSVNEDVLLLNLRKNINQRLASLGLNPQDQHSHLLLSGVVEGQALYKNIHGNNNSTDIDLSSAGIDAYILGPNSLTTGLISLRYDNNVGSQEGSLSINSRSQNSRVVVDKAFIILGDFLKSPFYGTLGQMYVPFGVYSTTMVSSPLTKLMFREQERAVLAGFQQQAKNAFYGAIFAFKGDSFAGSSSRINNGGINLGYKYNIADCYSGKIGLGYIGNVADSVGMQNTGNGAIYVPPGLFTPPQKAVFGGFGGVAGTGNEQIVHRVPAFDINGLFSISKTIDIIAEYITSQMGFNPNDMTMNNHGAKPQALNVEAAYTFQSLPKPTSLSIGYAQTKDALALGMPAKRYSTTVNTSFWRNTIQSLEFRHDVNYSLSAVSTGSGIAGPSLTGRTDNVVTAQFDLYF